MTTDIKTFRQRLIALPRWVKRGHLIANDFVLLSFALWAAYALRLNQLYVPPDKVAWLLFALAPAIGVVTFYFRGLYHLVTRFFRQEAAGRIYVTIALAVLVWALSLYLIGMPGVPRSVVLIYGLFAAGLIRVSRHGAGWLLESVPNVTFASLDPRRKVLIYGAGPAGQELARALSDSKDYKPAAFVDDNSSLQGQTIRGLNVHGPGGIPGLIQRHGVQEIFLALSSAPRRTKRAVIRKLESHPVTLKTLPALEDIASGQVEISDLRPIDVDDLLGRDPTPPDEKLLAKDIRGRNVLITGAGGSIGSELARQIIRLSPRRLVLFDVSEAALYQIEEEARHVLAGLAGDGRPASGIEVVAVLGSVLDGALLRHTLSVHDIQTIYHAAAYKHVPIVEQNPIMGLRNNTFGTFVLAESACHTGVERVVFISTDKAVRPTSVLGVSKRLAEMILQGFAAENVDGPVFTIVRFGNVLDSSGSVIHRFRRQIRDGGPLTVTHPDVVRYFMSIPEAAQLVLQAGAMAAGGEVFVLDMGKPVKIDELARTMVRLSGLEIRDDANPDGDIAIAYVGLRKGEKLYEELLNGENTAGTSHPRIMKSIEPPPKLTRLEMQLQTLDDAMEENDQDEIRGILKRTVEGYAQGEQAVMDPDSDGLGEWAPVSRLVH